MSADLLRQAAALMRERAEAAVPAGPWVVTQNERIVQHADGFDIAIAAAAFPGIRGTGWDATAQHIASWHPAVALAVADWLDLMVDMLVGQLLYDHSAEIERALAVARAYLATPT